MISIFVETEILDDNELKSENEGDKIKSKATAFKNRSTVVSLL